MVKVKICGLKEKEDVEFLRNFPVDYIGFIMYPKSPRYVGDGLKELLSIQHKAKKVVVFVNPSYEEVKTALDSGADLIQLHGEESLEFAKKIGLERVIKAFRVKDKLPSEIKNWNKAYAILLDTFVKGIAGGTGKSFNWNLAKEAVEAGYKIFLAGGLNPENVVEAISQVNPYAIDLSSGVECHLGKKDPAKIKELFKKLRLLTTASPS